MNIKDSYLHSDTPVIKSISVNVDKLTYTLADKQNTQVEVQLPEATITTNGILSKEDKNKLNQLNKDYITDITTYKFRPNDNGGKTSYVLIADISDWTEGSSSEHSFVGRICSSRGRNLINTACYNIVASVSSWGSNPTIFKHILYVDKWSKQNSLLPCVVKYKNTNYLALKKQGSTTNIYFEGLVRNVLSAFIYVDESNSTEFSEDFEIIHETNFNDAYSITTSNYYDGLTYRTLLHTGNYANYANNYTLPVATSSVLGGIKIGYNQSDKNYPVQLDSNDKAFVEVPWTDTKVTQSNTLEYSQYRVLLSGNPNNNTETTTIKKSNTLLYNPSNETLYVPNILTNGISNQYATSLEDLVKSGTKLSYKRFNKEIFNDELGITVASNANGVLWVGTHNAEGDNVIGYGHMLGFSGSKLYHKIVHNGDITRSWNQIAYTSSDITGNAATATKLKTARKLWGLDFDGSADVSGALSGVTTVTSAANSALVLQSSNANVYLRYNGNDNNSVCLISGALVPTSNSHNKLNLGRADNLWKGVYASNFYGNLNGSYIKALTGYTKATTTSTIAATDSLNTALGKLEYKADWACNWITDVTADDTDKLVNKWGEIVGFLDSVKEGTDILDEFVTRKTKLTITGIKTFTSNGWHSLLLRSYASDFNYNDLEEIIKHVSLGMTCLVPTTTDESNFEEHTGYFIYRGDSNYKLTDSGWYNEYTILHSGNSGISNGVITINGTLITPITSNSLSAALLNYVTLDGDQVISGQKSFSTSTKVYSIASDGFQYGVRLLGHGAAGYLQLGQITSEETKSHVGHITGINGTALDSLSIKSNSTSFTGKITTQSNIEAAGTITATGGFIGNLTGNATTATTAVSLKSMTIIESSIKLINTQWVDTGYTFANLATGTYAIQVTSGTNLVASGIMSVYANLSDTVGDEIPLHVYGTAGWRPYLRTHQNKLEISSNDASATSRTVTIKIAQIL